MPTQTGDDGRTTTPSSQSPGQGEGGLGRKVSVSILLPDMDFPWMRPEGRAAYESGHVGHPVGVGAGALPVGSPSSPCGATRPQDNASRTCGMPGWRGSALGAHRGGLVPLPNPIVVLPVPTARHPTIHDAECIPRSPRPLALSHRSDSSMRQSMGDSDNDDDTPEGAMASVASGPGAPDPPPPHRPAAAGARASAELEAPPPLTRMSTLRVGVPVGALRRSATGTGGSPSRLVSAVGMADAQAEAAGLLLTQPQHQHHQLGDAQAQAEAAGAARQGQGQGLEGGAGQEAVAGRGSPRGSGMLGMLFGDVDEVVNRLWRRVGFGPGVGCAMSEAKPAERDLPPQ